jgi:hypothetical protein
MTASLIKLQAGYEAAFLNIFLCTNTIVDVNFALWGLLSAMKSHRVEIQFVGKEAKVLSKVGDLVVIPAK